MAFWFWFIFFHSWLFLFLQETNGHYSQFLTLRTVRGLPSCRSGVYLGPWMIPCSLQGETVPSVPLNTIWWHQVSWSGLVVYADRALASVCCCCCRRISRTQPSLWLWTSLCISWMCELPGTSHSPVGLISESNQNRDTWYVLAALGCLMHNVLLCSCCSTLAQEKSTGTIVDLIWFDLTITIIQGLSSHFTFLIKIAKLLLYLF